MGAFRSLVVKSHMPDQLSGGRTRKSSSRSRHRPMQTSVLLGDARHPSHLSTARLGAKTRIALVALIWLGVGHDATDRHRPRFYQKGAETNRRAGPATPADRALGCSVPGRHAYGAAAAWAFRHRRRL